MRIVSLAVIALTACTTRIDGVWYGRHESAIEAGYEETLKLGDDGTFEREVIFTDDLGCTRVELSEGRYDWIGAGRVRFFVMNGREYRECAPRMEMNRPDMEIEGYDRAVSDEIDCTVTKEPERLFLECGATWTNRCFETEMPEEDCTPKATDK